MAEIENREIIIETKGGEQIIKDVDDIVLAVGSRPENNLLKKLEEDGRDVIFTGDAKSVRQALEAVEEGYRAGLAV